MKKYIAILTVFNLLFIAFSCDTFEGDADVPAYVQIDSVAFVSDLNTEGSSKQQITDVWFSANGSEIGAFEMPTRFPVISKGKQPVLMYAGILKNGIHIYRERYPFFDVVKDTFDFKGAEVRYTNPTFHYKKDLKFWIENFEDPGLKFHTSDSVNYLNQIIDPDNENNSIGEVYVPQNVSAFQFYTTDNFILSGDPIYMEIEYKSENSFSIGVLVEHIDGTYESVRPFSIIKESEGWNKLYINLSEQFYLSPSGKSYDVYFFFANSTGEYTKTFLDNIKIITYQK